MSNKAKQSKKANKEALPSNVQQPIFAQPAINISLDANQNGARLSYSLNEQQVAPNITPPTRPPVQQPALFDNDDIGPTPTNSQCKVSFESTPIMEAVDGIRFDFAFGYRITVPDTAPKSEYEIRVFDQKSGMLLQKHILKPGNGIVGNKKFFIQYRLEIWSENTLLFEHNYDCIGRKVHVIIPDGGLGDNLAWLPLVDIFRKTYKADVCCAMGEWMIRLAGDLYPGLHFLPVGDAPKLSGSYANYFCGIFGKDYDDWRPIDHQHLGMQGAVEAILDIPQGPVKCKLHTGSQRPFPEPYVCISTLATNPGKGWNYPNGWNDIIRFLKKCGYRVMDIDKSPTFYCRNQLYTIPSEAEDFTGAFPIQERINLLEHADFFIGLPSGLSWLAWNLDIPVVMIAGFTMPNCEFPTPYRVTNYLFCHGCWNNTNFFFDQNVPIWCPRHSGTEREIECTKVITPKMVKETIMKIPVFQKRLSTIITHNPAFSDTSAMDKNTEAQA